MQLSAERMRHTAEGEEFLESDTQLRERDSQYLDTENGGKGRPIHRDLTTAQEREYYGKVRMEKLFLAAKGMSE